MCALINQKKKTFRAFAQSHFGGAHTHAQAITLCAPRAAARGVRAPRGASRPPSGAPRPPARGEEGGGEGRVNKIMAKASAPLPFFKMSTTRHPYRTFFSPPRGPAPLLAAPTAWRRRRRRRPRRRARARPRGGPPRAGSGSARANRVLSWCKAATSEASHQMKPTDETISSFIR